MFKHLLLVLLITPIVTFTTYAQSVQFDGVDAFTGNRNIKTNFVSLKGDFKVQMAATVSKTDTIFLMNFYFPTNVTSLNDQSEVFFKLSDSSVVNFHYLGDYELCSDRRLCNIFISLKLNNLENFVNDTVTIIRIKTSSGLLDFSIREKRALMMNKLIKLLLNQLFKK